MAYCPGSVWSVVKSNYSILISDLLVHVPMDSITTGATPAIGTEANITGMPGCQLYIINLIRLKL